MIDLDGLRMADILILVNTLEELDHMVAAIEQRGPVLGVDAPSFERILKLHRNQKYKQLRKGKTNLSKREML